MRSTLLLLALLAACGGDDSPGGAIIDAPIDAPGDPDASTAPDAFGGNPLTDIGTVEQVATQQTFAFTEGPQWVDADGVWLFTDIPNNTIYRYRPGDAMAEVHRMRSGGANGLAIYSDGRLLSAEHTGRRVSIASVEGTVTALVDRFEGKRFNSPNDVVARSDGTVYFTDPPYGLGNTAPDLAFMGVFRVRPGQDAVAEWRGPATARPNGIALSPDQRTLYVADTDERVVRAFTVAASGALSDERIVVRDATDADGMAVDDAGNLFIATRAGVLVTRPDGTPWGTISVLEPPSNCAFGGPDRRTLFITAQTGVYQVQLAYPGLPTH
jgi:gluconolactonase